MPTPKIQNCQPFAPMGPMGPMLNTDSRREIFINDEISQHTCYIIDEIHRINHEDKEGKKIYGKKYKIRPIKIYINSYGGNANAALAIVDAINNSKTPVYTIATGVCMSAAVLILVNGVKRFATKHTTFMIHGISGMTGGTIPEIKEVSRNYENIEKIVSAMLVDKTKLKESKLTKIFQKERANWIFYYDDAVKYGLITDDIENVNKLPKKNKKAKNKKSESKK